MGVIYNTKFGNSYKNDSIYKKLVSRSKSSRESTSKSLTRENALFLQSLGLQLKHKKIKQAKQNVGALRNSITNHFR